MNIDHIYKLSSGFFRYIAGCMVAGLLVMGCGEQDEAQEQVLPQQFPAIQETFAGNIDLNNLFDYESQYVPPYISQDNSGNNPITNEGAVLGRVLFYDVSLSSDNSVSCASCHQQRFAFGDSEQVSLGVNGVTGRHSPRLVNARFSEEQSFFWDERASSLEEQTTMPIQDHNEMGFSGENGDPNLDDLISRLQDKPYYQELFEFVYGDPEVTEVRMQNALAQFIRSIQSFDSKYDEGLAQMDDDRLDFPNFTAEENLGKRLYMMSSRDGGAGCNTCHRAPEFDIDPDSDNNGVTWTAADFNILDLSVERSPTLRDLTNNSGQLNGPMMHTGDFTSLDGMIRFYNDIPVNENNNNLDNRLTRRGNQGQMLNLDDQEIAAIVSFLETLSGDELYSAEQWSDPFPDSASID